MAGKSKKSSKLAKLNFVAKAYFRLNNSPGKPFRHKAQKLHFVHVVLYEHKNNLKLLFVFS